MLLFGLSLATALPPVAMPTPPGAVYPAATADAHAALGRWELAAILGRPASEIGRSRVDLAKVHPRLRGLEIWLDLTRIIDTSGALVCLSVAQPDPVASSVSVATSRDLWILIGEALERHGVPYERQPGIGEAAFLACYGGVTAQLTWLTADRLATVSVTAPSRDMARSMDQARSTAVLLDRALSR